MLSKIKRTWNFAFTGRNSLFKALGVILFGFGSFILGVYGTVFAGWPGTTILTVIIVALSIAAIIAVLANIIINKNEEFQMRLTEKDQEFEKLKWRIEDLYRLFPEIRDESTGQDPITGLPNYRALESDITKRYIPSTKEILRYKADNPPIPQPKNQTAGGKLPFHAVFLDLDDFRSINEKLGFFRGSLVIREFAQRVYTSMRRNEYMYRAPEIIGKTHQIDTQLFRIGGDEFFFIVNGSELDALGFIRRLAAQMGRYSEEISQKLGEQLALSFHAGLSPIEPSDDLERLIHKVWFNYREAKKNTLGLRVVWQSAWIVWDLDGGWEDPREFLRILAEQMKMGADRREIEMIDDVILAFSDRDYYVQNTKKQ